MTAAAATAAAVGMLLGHVGKILASGGVTHYKKKENVKKSFGSTSDSKYNRQTDFVILIHLLER